MEKLIEDPNRWNRAEVIRRYVDDLEAIGKEKGEVKLIRNKADWIHPTTGKHDLIMGEYTTELPKNPSYW